MATPSRAQIDRLGDRLRRGSPTDSDLRLLDDYRRSFGEAYEVVVQTIREKLRLEPTGRPAKSTGSLVEKLRRESIRLIQVQDIAGCRLVASDLEEQERVVASLRSLFPGASVVDRRVNPSYGYRAVHVVVEIAGKPVEIQIRTSLQHLWAELSEKLSDVIDPTIKYGGGDDETRDLLGATSQAVAAVEEAEKKQAAFDRAISGVPPERRGELEELSRGQEKPAPDLAAMKRRLNEMLTGLLSIAEHMRRPKA
jgi:ppGpp synthetase/RelA/SpoT-type nucleotidyltranferase